MLDKLKKHDILYDPKENNIYTITKVSRDYKTKDTPVFHDEWPIDFISYRLDNKEVYKDSCILSYFINNNCIKIKDLDIYETLYGG